MAKKHEEEYENYEWWLVSYVDFIILLFAFFTVLYATSQKDISKAIEFQRSVKIAFRSLVPVGGPLGEFPDNKVDTQIIQPPIDVVPRDGTGPNEMTDYVERQVDKNFTAEDRAELDVWRDDRGTRLRVAEGLLFDAGEALLKPESLPKLNKVAKMIRNTNRKVYIEGHTDSIPTKTERFPSNWELSSARASTIARFLTQIGGVKPENITVVGYASNKPLELNDTPEHRAKNRRIEVLIVTDEKAP
jgi:chemotaxis protein MotB